jgi:hypothetical protein
MVLTQPSAIPVDKEALRRGYPAAGWLVMFLDDEEKWIVSNKLFPTEEAAVWYGTTFPPDRRPRVKAVRHAEG